MFDFAQDDFFPTPAALARELAAPYLGDPNIHTVLDPSAGKGDLLAPFFDREVKRYAIEKAPELQSILRGLTLHGIKEAQGLEHWQIRHCSNTPLIQVLGADIFDYQGRHHFDLIVMNPPFSNGVDHLMRAWELLAPGGKLACILPTDMFRNTCYKKRQLLVNLVDANGTREDKGSRFANAERKTSVEVSIIRLDKPAAEGFDFRFNKITSRPTEIKFDDLDNQIARNDQIGNAVTCFDSATKALQDLARAWKTADFYLSAIGIGVQSIAPLDHRATANPANINSMIDAAQVKAWRYVIEKSNVNHLFTEKMRTEFDALMSGQGAMDFNVANIRALFATMFASRASIADRCVQDVFERLCSYDPKNKIHVEGWKTNSAYKVNQKVILPGFIRLSWTKGLAISYHRDYSALDDIDKALCTVTGRPFDSVRTIRTSLEEAFKNVEDKAESEFFSCKAYKKGTLHLKFKDRKVWELFNMAAARGRGWLAEAA